MSKHVGYCMHTIPQSSHTDFEYADAYVRMHNFINVHVHVIYICACMYVYINAVMCTNEVCGV